MADQPVEGAYFRRNYIRPDKKISDSQRARRRIHELAELVDKHDLFVKRVKFELGIPYPYGGYEGYDHEKYWTDCEVADFLSSVTMVFDLSGKRADVLRELRRIFDEEHLRYRIDDKGGVHYLIDEHFERNVAAAIDGLGTPKFEAARHALEHALQSMTGTTPSGKALVKGVFEAVESAFLVRIQPAPESVNILNEPNVIKYLRPVLETRYATVPEAKDKIDRVLEIHKAWVKAAHPFRHGVPFDQIHEAPLDYAILLADQGMAFLRYIVAK